MKELWSHADLHGIASNDLAIVQNYEVGSNIGPDGEIEKVSIRATNIFRKEKGEWKMVSHHTDFLPNNAAAFRRRASRLHLKTRLRIAH
jgi:ketosteroid isomerase-like protein